MLKNTLTPDQFTALDDLASVLQATGRAMKGQSTTIPHGQQLKELQREAVSPAADAMNLNYGARLRSFWTDMATGRCTEQFANVLTDETLMSNLHAQVAQLKKLSARDSALLPTLTQTLTLIGVEGMQ